MDISTEDTDMLIRNFCALRNFVIKLRIYEVTIILLEGTTDPSTDDLSLQTNLQIQLPLLI
jgi:DNA invertase Pin-like site-specific DNA recombinase